MFIKSALSPPNETKKEEKKNRIEKAKQENKQKIEERNNKIFGCNIGFLEAKCLRIACIPFGFNWCETLMSRSAVETDRIASAENTSEINEIIQFFFYFYTCFCVIFLNGCKLPSNRWARISCSLNSKGYPLWLVPRFAIIH